MRVKDIKVGERYLVSHGSCGKVLETRVERSTWGGKSRKDGVRVIFENGYRKGKEAVVASRAFSGLWSEYEAAREEQELRRKIANQDRDRLAKEVGALEKALEKAGIDPVSAGVTYSFYSGERQHAGSIVLSEEAIKSLTALIAAPDTLRKAEEIQAEPSEDPLADLL